MAVKTSQITIIGARIVLKGIRASGTLNTSFKEQPEKGYPVQLLLLKVAGPIINDRNSNESRITIARRVS